MSLYLYICGIELLKLLKLKSVFFQILNHWLVELILKQSYALLLS